jgi:hypothetical protein
LAPLKVWLAFNQRDIGRKPGIGQRAARNVGGVEQGQSRAVAVVITGMNSAASNADTNEKRRLVSISTVLRAVKVREILAKCRVSSI